MRPLEIIVKTSCVVKYVVLVATIGVLSSCQERPRNSEVPDCALAAQTIIDQSAGRDETYIKRPRSVSDLTVLEQTDTSLICRGIATLSDSTRIPVHIKATKINSNWMYQVERGSHIQ
jgi:hypothetical protein